MQDQITSTIKKQKKLFFKILFVLVIVSLTTLVLRAKTEKIYIVDPNNANIITSVPFKKAHLIVGDVFIKNNIEVSISKVFARDYMRVQSTNVLPIKGSVFIIVHYSLKNNSSKTIKPSKQPKIKLQDARGTIYKNDNTKTDNNGTSYYFAEKGANPTALSNLNPNFSTQDILVFEVPKVSAHTEGWQVLVEGLGSPILIDIL